jgi:HEAT repeat protein
MKYFLLGSLAVLLLVLGLLFWAGRSGDSSTSLPGRDGAGLTSQDVPDHIEALRHADAATRKRAATALWQIGSYARAATPALRDAAKDPDPEVREAAVKALGLTSQGTTDAVPVLVEALRDKQAEVRAAAGGALAELWATENAGRRRAPGGGGPGGSPSPGASLPRLGPQSEAAAQAAVPVLTEALRDPDARVRAPAAAALAETGPLARAAVADLVHILQEDQDRDARLQATIALGNIGPDSRAAVPVLVQKLRDEKADGVRVNTAAALGRIRSDPALVVPALVETFLKDPHPDARTWALLSLGQFGPEAKLAIPALEAALKDPANQERPDFRKHASGLLDRIRSQLAEEPAPSAPGQPPRK